MFFKLSEIAFKLDGEIVGDHELEIAGVSTIEDAEEGELTFLANPKYYKFLKNKKASAIIFPYEMKEGFGKSLVRTKNPYYAFLQAVHLFYPATPLIEKGIHPTANIREDVQLGKDLSVGPYVVIGQRCSIGDRTVIMPGVVIGNGVTVGEGCILHSHVCLREKVIIGNRVVLHDGVVIGSDGFGFAPEGGQYYKIPQVGNVIIEDDVEIGANVTIDRATLGETRIKEGAKLDNLIQIGHNCTVGKNSVIAAQTGLSGSTHIGSGVRVGGQVGFAGHMKIGDGAAIGAQSGVNKSVAPGEYVFGYPAKPHMEEFRIQAALKKLPKMLKDLQNLKERIKRLEQKKRE
jgi:UDP-3-O-[3-hydroxymyristoyl] glucosamine N-acyltransferase